MNNIVFHWEKQGSKVPDVEAVFSRKQGCFSYRMLPVFQQ